MRIFLCASFVLGLMVGDSLAELISVDIGPNSQFERRATVSQISGDHSIADLYDPGQIEPNDQIGIWAGSGATNWWNSTLSNVTFSANNLVDADGNVTGVSYNGTLGYGTDWATSPDDDLGWDGHFVSGGSAIESTISGLSADTIYDLVVYHADLHRSETVTVNGVDPIDYTGDLANLGYTDAFDVINGSDFWYFQVATDSDGDLTISSGGDGAFNSLTGFQVQALPVPEPSSAILMLFSLIASCLFAWRQLRHKK